jgi:carboxymethylenebutenolidase
MPMLNRFNVERSIGVVILGVILSLAGCDTSGPDASSQAPSGAGDVAVSAAQQPAASEASPLAAQQAVISERLPYGEVDDKLVYGHFVFPADMIDPLPAVIVIHDGWGLNDSVRSQADRLAAEGFIVLAVDLFSGETATSVSVANQYMRRVVENPEIAQENMRKAYEFVSGVAGAPQVASLGWGFGGGWALDTAMLFPEDLDAAVIYYTQVRTDAEELQLLNIPILAHFGNSDKGISMASVRSFEDALERLRKNYDFQIYPGVGQGFADPGAPGYNANAAEKAWQTTLAFLDQNLSAPAEELE